MFKAIRRLFGGQNYQPLNKIEISKKNLFHNYKYLTSVNPQIKIAPVLKSNAYGHGITLIAKALDRENCPFFCVDSLFEAYELLKAKIKTPVLITGYIDPENLKVKKLPFSYAVFDLDFAKAVNEYQKGAEVHIFVGTGMSREGVPLSQLAQFIKELKKLKNIRIAGLMTHFASADNPKSKLTQAQQSNFQKAKQICLEHGLDSKWFHVGGSFALYNNLVDGVNLVRSGRAIYGLSGLNNNLKPLLSLKTKIAQIKKISKGAKVGYSETYVAKKDMVIGILPIGYNDGVDRRLSNKGAVLVDGIKCPIIGLISMNITTIDLSGIKNPKKGQEVLVFSRDPKDPNSIEKAAEACQTLQHDLLVHLSPFTRRELV